MDTLVEISALYEQVKQYQKLSRDKTWTSEIKRTRENIIRNSAPLKKEITRLTGKKLFEKWGREYDVWDTAFSQLPTSQVQIDAIELAQNIINEAIGILEAEAKSWGIKAGGGIKAGSDIQSAAGIEAGKDVEAGGAIIAGSDSIKKHISQESNLDERPKVFIAHGGKSGTLDKLCQFIQALGLEPLVVELLPSQGLPVDAKVEKYIHAADCGIVLATSGGIVDKTTNKIHPRLNVIDEFARLRARFPNKTILLLEKGVCLPSNISGITYEPFVRQSMDRAFCAIARELAAFKIILAVKPPKEVEE